MGFKFEFNNNFVSEKTQQKLNLLVEKNKITEEEKYGLILFVSQLLTEEEGELIPKILKEEEGELIPNNNGGRLKSRKKLNKNNASS